LDQNQDPYLDGVSQVKDSPHLAQTKRGHFFGYGFGYGSVTVLVMIASVSESQVVAMGLHVNDC
jgi:hypothetical protein